MHLHRPPNYDPVAKICANKQMPISSCKQSDVRTGGPVHTCSPAQHPAPTFDTFMSLQANSVPSSDLGKLENVGTTNRNFQNEDGRGRPFVSLAFERVHA